jgi:hypothetical protein
MNRAAARRWRVVIEVLLVVAALATDGFAAPSLVVVVRPAEPGAVITEVLTRVRGELVASGFQVALVDHVPGAEPANEMKSIAAKFRPLAIFGIFEQPDGGAADVWIVDLMAGKTIVQRVQVGTRDGSPNKDGSSVQAVRAVDLLRASLLELVVERSTLPPPAAQAAPPAPVQRETSADAGQGACPGCAEPGAFGARSGQVGLEAGAAVLHSFEGIGPSFSPILRTSYQPASRLALRVSAAGFGTEPSLDAPEGRARIAQQFAMFELLPIFFADRALRPVLSIGVGAYNLRAEGSAGPPYAPTTQSLLGAVFDAGIGGHFSVSRHFGLSIEVHALFTSSYPMVRIAQSDVGRAGRPSILSSLTLVATP